MRYQRAISGVQQKIAGYAAQDPFSNAAVAIRTGNQKIGPFAVDNVAKSGGIITGGGDHQRCRGDIMALQPGDNVLQPKLGSFPVVGGRNLGHGNPAGGLQDWKRIANRPAGFPRVLPADNHMSQRQMIG